MSTRIRISSDRIDELKGVMALLKPHTRKVSKITKAPDHAFYKVYIDLSFQLALRIQDRGFPEDVMNLVDGLFHQENPDNFQSFLNEQPIKCEDSSKINGFACDIPSSVV